MSFIPTAIPASVIQSTNFDALEFNVLSDLNRVTAIVDKESSPFNYHYGLPSGILQKNIIYQQNVFSGTSDKGTTSFYNRFFVFPVPRGCGYLSQVVLEVTLTAAGDNSNAKPRMGSRLFQDISFETTRGLSNIYQHITPDYTNARCDQLTLDQYQIQYSLDPLTLWTSGNTTVYCPCFFQFSENQNTFINVDECEPLQVRCLGNSSANAIGLPTDITDFFVRAQFTFFKVQESIPRFGASFPTKRSMLITDVFYEKGLALTNGSSYINFPITCTLPAFNMTVIIRDSSQNYIRCQKIILYSGSNIIVAMDKSCNYSLMNGSTENNQVGSMTYWFSVKRDRTVNQGAMNLNDIYALNLGVYYDTVPNGNYSLYVLFEYYDQLLINEQGQYLRQIHY